jgi:hypothetical protein
MPHLEVAPQHSPPATGEFVGVGIRTTDIGSGQKHVVLVYSRPDESTWQLGLDWHYRLHDEQWDPRNLWQTAGDLDPTDLPTVIAYLEHVRRSKPRIPYAFRALGCRFSVNATSGLLEFDAKEVGAGLTCATFIVFFFRAMQFPLINAESWPTEREGDAEWREKIIDWMRKTNVPQAHIDAVVLQTPETRVRPEEVVAAFIQPQWPKSFDECVDVALEIATEVDAQLPAH